MHTYLWSESGVWSESCFRPSLMGCALDFKTGPFLHQMAKLPISLGGAGGKNNEINNHRALCCE